MEQESAQRCLSETRDEFRIRKQSGWFLRFLLFVLHSLVVRFRGECFGFSLCRGRFLQTQGYVGKLKKTLPAFRRYVALARLLALLAQVVIWTHPEFFSPFRRQLRPSTRHHMDLRQRLGAFLLHECELIDCICLTPSRPGPASLRSVFRNRCFDVIKLYDRLTALIPFCFFCHKIGFGLK
jgi:hypothetical protein